MTRAMVATLLGTALLATQLALPGTADAASKKHHRLRHAAEAAAAVGIAHHALKKHREKKALKHQRQSPGNQPAPAGR